MLGGQKGVFACSWRGLRACDVEAGYGTGIGQGKDKQPFTSPFFPESNSAITFRKAASLPRSSLGWPESNSAIIFRCVAFTVRLLRLGRRLVVVRGHTVCPSRCATSAYTATPFFGDVSLLKAATRLSNTLSCYELPHEGPTAQVSA